mgnify:CR=1 FL=1
MKTTTCDSVTSAELDAELAEVVARATRRIAPVWPLAHFVAVNPYLGLSDYAFEAAADVLQRRAGTRLTAPRAVYAEALASGRITQADLAAALRSAPQLPGAPADVEALIAVAHAAPPSQPATLPTVADVARQVRGIDWPEVVVEAISRWAAAYFDAGQAHWPSPWAHLPAFSAWREEALLDRTPETLGVTGFRAVVATLPTSPTEVIAGALRELAIPEAGREAYLHRLLLTINGWASYARYRQWTAELRGGEDTTLVDLLAIRLVWEVALIRAMAADGVAAAWQLAMPALIRAADPQLLDAAQVADVYLQRAFEIAYQRTLVNQLGARATQPAAGPADAPRAHLPAVQAAFCIDVRSEVFRRGLETANPAIATIGFAGFFGVPIEYVRFGENDGSAQCPVLISPKFVIAETVQGATPHKLNGLRTLRHARQRAAKAWRMFKFGAVACFGFVGPVGLTYVRNLIADTLGWGRPVPLPATFGLSKAAAAQLGPSIVPQPLAARSAGMGESERVTVAESMLRGMSLTTGFARLVALVGHGATTVNNPYAAGLDCGACGGHSGEANARVAAMLLNDPDVRAGLQHRGILIPEDTVFVAAKHDTTTDEVTVFDVFGIPATHRADLDALTEAFAAAGRLARAERAPRLNLSDGVDIDSAIAFRSRDWSQVRPEWGLAGCAAFIVAPREVTRGVDLGGRAFLHSYTWEADADFSVLELIMTAPMVVASWINLQYYASTVDNRLLGSGNKVLHNVTGALGVLEGNGGDLRTGLPWQSVHDGTRYVHEPLRLTVMIRAPIAAMNAVLVRHPEVRRLVDNGWLHLFALGDTGAVTHQYCSDFQWSPVVGNYATPRQAVEAVLA